MWWFSVYDFINISTGHELGNDYAYQTFKRLVKPGSEHANDILTNCQDVKFSGHKQKSTPATGRGDSNASLAFTVSRYSAYRPRACGYAGSVTLDPRSNARQPSISSLNPTPCGGGIHKKNWAPNLQDVYRKKKQKSQPINIH